MARLVSSFLLLLLGAALGQEACVQETNCMRADGCVCATTVTPIDPLPSSFAPQFVVVSFNDAVTVSNYDFYHDIVTTYRNPNGCRMTMTMFLNHLNNDYTLSNELWRLGSEIGVRSVTASSVEYWKSANYTVWHNEIQDTKKMISKYGRIPEAEILGTRAPHMQIGGDEMYQALTDAGFGYDSSWTALAYTNWYGSPAKGALYPYTLDFKSPQIPDDCPVGRCPENLYKGLFVTPVLDLESFSGYPCNMIDACESQYNETDCPEQVCEDNVFEFLKKNFEHNYNGNRAPFGLHTAPSWFEKDKINNSTAHTRGYKRFLEYAASLEEVWIVSHNKVVEYMKDPVPYMDVGNLDAFKCPSIDPDSNCPDPLRCDYKDTQGFDSISMTICTRPCPDHYPWLGNVDGK
ncbi:chitin deacetylase 8-like [Macrobrachium rosenbergii]|uniref:chitin deacetylase 8-like n=1 Tax=Macrobrachium rosenbergii TaxID=79674 RepID=UPI0034D66283